MSTEILIIVVCSLFLPLTLGPFFLFIRAQERQFDAAVSRIALERGLCFNASGTLFGHLTAHGVLAGRDFKLERLSRRGEAGRGGMMQAALSLRSEVPAYFFIVRRLLSGLLNEPRAGGMFYWPARHERLSIDPVAGDLGKFAEVALFDGSPELVKTLVSQGAQTLLKLFGSKIYGIEVSPVQVVLFFPSGPPLLTDVEKLREVIDELLHFAEFLEERLSGER